MIEATFRRSGTSLVAVNVKGHAGLAPAGEDILCAGVSVAIQMTANGITEVLKEKAAVEVREDQVSITLPVRPEGAASLFLEALLLQLILLREEYPRHITVTEV